MFILILPVLFSIVLGYILRKSNFLTDAMIDGFKKIVINVTLPALLLTAFTSIKFQQKYWAVFLAIFLACGLLLVLASGLAKLFKIESPYFPFLITGFEAGMIGYALYASFYDGSVAEFAVIDVGQVLFVFIALVPMVMMTGGMHQGKTGISDSLKSALKSPVVWAIIIGVLLSAFGVSKFAKKEWYQAIEKILNYISLPTSFLICLVIGSGLKFSFANMKNELITVGTRLVLTLLIAFFVKAVVLTPLKLTKSLNDALFIMFLLPGPFVIPAFMQNASMEEKTYVSNTLSLNTLVSLLAIFIAVGILKG
ncbi:MAG: AEC family transporter [Eubacteriales bacterium]